MEAGYLVHDMSFLCGTYFASGWFSSKLFTYFT